MALVVWQSGYGLKNINVLFDESFLAALSSSRSQVVRPSVGRSVVHSCEKGTFTVSKDNKTYLPTYL